MQSKILKASIFGGLGVVCRYLISFLIHSTPLSISIINISGIVLMGLTNNFSETKKYYYHTGFLGGFTSLSTLFLLQYSLYYVIMNILVGMVIYELILKYQK